MDQGITPIEEEPSEDLSRAKEDVSLEKIPEDQDEVLETEGNRPLNEGHATPGEPEETNDPSVELPKPVSVIQPTQVQVPPI